MTYHDYASNPRLDTPSWTKHFRNPIGHGDHKLYKRQPSLPFLQLEKPSDTNKEPVQQLKWYNLLAVEISKFAEKRDSLDHQILSQQGFRACLESTLVSLF
jgi:hypothetical protein